MIDEILEQIEQEEKAKLAKKDEKPKQIVITEKDRIVIEIIRALQAKSFNLQAFYDKYGEERFNDVLIFCTEERLVKGVRAKIKRDNSIEVCVLKHPIVTFKGLIFLNERGLEFSVKEQ